MNRESRQGGRNGLEQNDIVTKNFESYADVAADIINALIHNGTQEIKSENLLSAATESLYADRKNILHNQLEDVAKYHIIEGVPGTMYLFANQTKADKGMLLRKAGYVGGEYRRQYEKQNRGWYPVVELVLYWGKSRWKGADSIRQLMDRGSGKVAKTTWKYVDNMQLHVWEMRYLPQEVREHFQSDMRIVLDYLAEGNGYRSDRKVVHKEATIKMLRMLSGDRNVEDTREILEKMNITEEAEISMCELFDQYTRRGIAQGVAQGIIIMCKEFNASYEETLQKVRAKLNVSEQEAEKEMQLYW